MLFDQDRPAKALELLQYLRVHQRWHDFAALVLKRNEQNQNVTLGDLISEILAPEPPEPAGALRKFTCSYAYSVGCYADFTVKARSEQQALQICQAALKAGKFNDVECEVNWDNIDSHRVFVQGESTDPSFAETLKDLISCSTPPI